MNLDSLKRILNNKYLWYFVFLCAMYCISFNIPLVTDDFAYSMSRLTKENLNSIYDVLLSVGHEYMTWNGRILGYFTGQMMLLSDTQMLFRFSFPIVNLIIAKQLFDLSFSKNNNVYIVCVVALLFSAHILVLNQTMFWIIGWSIYVFPLIFIIPIISYAKDIYSENNKRHNPIKLAFFAFVGSLYVEHYSLIIVGVSLFVILYELITKKTCSKTSLYILITSVLGNLLIFLAPGLTTRASADLTSTFDFANKLHFGWSRFIYSFFYMNQRVFFVLSVALVVYMFKQLGWKKGIIFSAPLMPIAVMSILLITKSSLLNPIILECLTGEWAYYTCELKHLLAYSTIVIYYILIFLIYILYVSWKDKSIYLFVIYGAAVMSSLIFILSNMACERTQFISFILLLIIVLFLFNELIDYLNKLIIILVLVASLILNIYNFGKFIINYDLQFDIYESNKEKLEKCGETNCKYIELEEHDYRYVFKSDLNFEDQNGWVLNTMRRYYGLDDETVITSSNK